MFEFLRDQPETTMWLVGAAAAVMIIREIIKLVLIGGMVAKYGAIHFRATYWLHMAATVALTIAFAIMVTA